ncbi:hypothetical protein MRB53_001573 [Persea americana]|uniref:Uncharacterized protein n=1 Tax=Persea americana TaxID=3435 RepID=A0ACC2MS41_PERAE|nr:hypothetical protein MRB53_001573 [Persea americana]|eukprot:TRINITY_DN22801_c2_g1_i2.p3 TRINITY_DN22801_c2_g1~~TRINITY_DN22801_c2_g1_i2.p3  ORF type:complete len:101 (+),score=26.11 TRINITY_DN22801_c2_g1_i2:1068-1370(+)
MGSRKGWPSSKTMSLETQMGMAVARGSQSGAATEGAVGELGLLHPLGTESVFSDHVRFPLSLKKKGEEEEYASRERKRERRCDVGAEPWGVRRCDGERES